MAICVFPVAAFPWNANDYARSWYSCDEVERDLELRYFNIDRDKQTIIPLHTCGTEV